MTNIAYEQNLLIWWLIPVTQTNLIKQKYIPKFSDYKCNAFAPFVAAKCSFANDWFDLWIVYLYLIAQVGWSREIVEFEDNQVFGGALD